MNIDRAARGFVKLVLVLAATATAVAALPAETRSSQGATIVINEVQYDPPPSGSENGYEWLELLNTGPAPVTLEGWSIADARASDAIPTATIGPGALLVVAGGAGFAELHPGFTGSVVVLEGSIGNGLGNSGDQVKLLGPGGTMVDGMSYGDDAGVLDPAAPDVEAGHSLERVPAGADTDTAGDWFDQGAPSPGERAGEVPPTAAPTTAARPTLPPGARVVLNEHLPAPRDVDWDGDGTAGAEDEWVELYNPGDAALDLRGWQLDDIADGGSSPYAFPDGTVIAPRGYLVIFRRASGVSLNNGGDSVRLLDGAGAVVDETQYSNAKPDISLARDGDGDGAWTDALAPSPGRGNHSGGTPGPQPTAGAAPTARPGPTDRPSPVPSVTPVVSPAPSAPVPTPGARPTPDGVYLPFLVSELMFDPAATGNDAAGEWVELHNRSDAAAHLAGWAIGDRSAWDVLPDALVPPRGFVIVAASPAAVAGSADPGAAVAVVADGRIGGGLGNGGDVVRLRGPTGETADAVSYGDNLDAFDPAVPTGPPGSSIERLPPDADTDRADDWWIQPAPSPGRAGQRHEGPARIVINEVLPAPRAIDWDGDGTASFGDEWVELYNVDAYPVDLGDWRLVVGEPERWSYRVGSGATIAAHAHRVFHRAESALALGNSADVLRLVRPDGVVADTLAWDRPVGDDRSWSRTLDGGGTWTSDFAVTPGGPNRPPRADEAPPASRTPRHRATPFPRRRAPTPTPRPTDPPRWTVLGDVRTVAPGVRVQVRGQVTVAPGTFGWREAYLGDETGGVKVFVKDRNGRLPSVPEGVVVIATGVLADYHGEREVVIATAADFWADEREGPMPPVPVDVTTGAVGEPVEGRLVRVGGRVIAYTGTTLTLDDGTGPVRVVVRSGSGVRRPRVAGGQSVVVVGIAGQYARRAPWPDGYRITPRRGTDFGSSGRSEVVVPDRMPRAGR
jgi:hypothetical protein